MLWVMILTYVLKTGDVKTEIRWPLTQQMNSEAECNKQADAAASQEQLKIGLDNGTVLYICQAIPFKDIKPLVQNSGSDL